MLFLTPASWLRSKARPGGRGLAALLGLLMSAMQPETANATVAAGNPRFESLTTEQGLPQESVLAIAQDAQGFIWMNTQAGLARYDGYHVTVYKHDPARTDSVADNYADTVHADREGNLWIGTRNGLDRYDPATDSFSHIPVPPEAGGKPAPTPVYAIADDGAKGLWIGMRDGLHHFDPAADRFDRLLQHSENLHSLSSNRITALCLDGHGTLWIGTVKGLNRLPSNAQAVERTGPGNSAQPYADVVQALLADRNDRLWIGAGDGLIELPLSGATAGQPHRLSSAEGVANTGAVATLLQDRAGDLWFGSDKGLWRADSSAQTFAHYRHLADDPFSLVDDAVYSLFQARDGVLWIGTWYGGASRLDLASGGFQRYRHSIEDPQSLSNSQVISIVTDNRDHAWVATSDGLDDLDLTTGRTLAVFRHDEANPASLRNSNLTALGRDTAGRLWIGSTDGLDRMDTPGGPVTHINLKTADPQADGSIQQIARGLDGTMWVAAGSEIYRFDPAGPVQAYRSDAADPGSLVGSSLNAILVDRHGTLWVGSNGGGLDRKPADSEHFEHYPSNPGDPQSLSHDRVQALLEARDGTLWVGTAQGLNRAVTGTDGRQHFQRYMTVGEAPLDSIGGIEEDEHGQLWISTTSGILCFDPKTAAFRSYSARDGLIGGSYFIGSSWKDETGRILFGGLNGLTVFRPADIHDNPTPPAVAITDFLVFNQSVHAAPQSLSAPRTLSYRDSVFSFVFAALHFADPQRNRYAFKLEGFDHDWIQTDASQRFATYTNLEPGHYRFLVKASNKDGAWSEPGPGIAITITPPFWKTWWFRVTAAFLLMGSAGFFYYRRVRGLIEQRTELERLVAERTTQVTQQKDELQKAYNLVEAASLTDPLTGLYNRRFLQRHVEADAALAIRGQTPPLRPSVAAGTDQQADLLFFLVDIDFFKTINDQHGHGIGDQVLIETGRRLRGLSRDSDYIVRWGGEEFLMVARGSIRGHAERIAERIRETIASRPFEMEGGIDLEVTCSVGFTCFPFLLGSPRALSWMQALDIADHALYMAKRRGRNTWVGIVSNIDKPTAEVVEQIVQSPQKAAFDGHLKLLLRGAPAVAGDAKRPATTDTKI